jgi:hypothetical protein
MGRTPPGLTLLRLAAVAGGLHTAASLYWATGGTWLLATVGQAALDLQRDQPLLATTTLLAAALAKGIGAVVPLWGELRAGPRWRRVIRAAGWVGGGCLVLYGTVFAVVAAAVLTGLITPDGAVDRTGLMGHALLWDPLFALWGAFLLAGLWRSRRVTTER